MKKDLDTKYNTVCHEVDKLRKQMIEQESKALQMAKNSAQKEATLQKLTFFVLRVII